MTLAALNHFSTYGQTKTRRSGGTEKMDKGKERNKEGMERLKGGTEEGRETRRKGDMKV